MFSQASHNSRLSAVAPVRGSTETIARINELIAGLRPDNADLLAAFHRIQHEFGYVPREAVPLLAGKFRTTPAIIFGAIDFYSEVRTAPPAQEVVEWCSGPACLLKGSMQIRRALEGEFQCWMNHASADGRFELRLVQCDGTCHLAPELRHRGRYLGPLTTSDAIRFARALKAQTPAPDQAAAAVEAGGSAEPGREPVRPEE